MQTLADTLSELALVLRPRATIPTHKPYAAALHGLSVAIALQWSTRTHANAPLVESSRSAVLQAVLRVSAVARAMAWQKRAIHKSQWGAPTPGETVSDVGASDWTPAHGHGRVGTQCVRTARGAGTSRKSHAATACKTKKLAVTAKFGDDFQTRIRLVPNPKLVCNN